MEIQPGTGESVVSVSDENYSNFLIGKSVVTFGIASCQACNELDPILEEAAGRFSGEVKFGKAKMHIPGACREIKRRFDFETFPTTHFYRNGELVHTLEGKVESEEFARLLLEHVLRK